MNVAFGTKAETLQMLQSRGLNVPDMYYFNVMQWLTDKALILEGVRLRFGTGDRQIIVRSSARNEDNEHSSMAGAFHSVLGGVPLGSVNGAKMTYAQGTSQAEREADQGQPPSEPWLRHPRPYPTKDTCGRAFYSTANFMDAAFWLIDVMRASGMAIVNTSNRSLLHAPFITVDEDYLAPEAAAAPAPPWPGPAGSDAAEAARLAGVLDEHLRFWQTVRQRCNECLAMAQEVIGRWQVEHGRELLPGDLMQPCSAVEGALRTVIATLDDVNVTYLLIRFPGFDYPTFCKFYSDDLTAHLVLAGRHYMEFASAMSQTFVETIEGSLQRLLEGVRP